MNEDFVADICLDFDGLLNDFEKFLACTLIVRPVSVDHVDQSTAFLYVLDRVTFEHVIAWEVDHVELNVVIVAHNLRLNSASRQQEKCLVRGHLLEDNFTDTCLARSKGKERRNNYIFMHRK